MLNPNDDRLYYGNLLSPPEDYRIDFAIGTTYSLEFVSLVTASISIALDDDVDSKLMKDKILLLKELRKTSDKMILFCESGMIHFPKIISPLYILLENIIFQVIPKKDYSFHPKFWLLKYVDETENVLYRLIVLSRNLTSDRSWDISFSMDGKKSEIPTDKNNPIIDFINYLIKFTTDNKKISKMKEIIDELKYIRFDLDHEIFKDFDFIINGIGGNYSIQNQSLYLDNLNELLIVSPFLSKNIINHFNNLKNSNSKALLFTRKESLSKLKPNDCDNFEIYTLKEDVIMGESRICEESQEISNQDIHAKLYYIENKNSSELYLGSLNASRNAFIGNVEVMMKLKAKKSKFSVNQLADDLFNEDKGGPNNPFKLVKIEDLDPEESSEESKVDFIMKDISYSNPKARIISHENTYDIEVKFENVNYNLIKDVSVFIKPLYSDNELEFSESMLFENLSKLDLSEFFIVTVKDESDIVRRVLKINTEGMPENRQDEVISSIITNETDFIKYIIFLLGDDYIISAIENENIGKSSKSITLDLPELYEKMLKTACYSPDKLDEIKFLVRALNDKNVIPEGFKELYNTFMMVID